MNITQCSKTSINTYNQCVFKYYLKYILKLEDLYGKAALQGNIIHKVFEWISKLKQKNKIHIDHMWLLERSWDMHVHTNPHIQLRRVTSRGESADFRKCRLAIETILATKEYNPYNLDIIASELYFRIAMPGEEWQTENNEQLIIHGFIDLIHKIDEKTIEIIDWKTGTRYDFITKKQKDVFSLFKDAQARIYHFAVTELYPEYENILITFFYTGDGGPITVEMNITDIPITISALWNFFKKVQKTNIITRNRGYHCKMCPYEKSGVCNKAWNDLGLMGREYVENKYFQLSFEDQQCINGNV